MSIWVLQVKNIELIGVGSLEGAALVVLVCYVVTLRHLGNTEHKPQTQHSRSF
jgi:hypothetical protein